MAAQAPAVRPPVPGAPAGVTAFVDVNVIPMDTDRMLPHQTVLVHEGRIAALGPAATTAVPRDAARIDGRGQYLLPGLGACHGHVTSFIWGWLPPASGAPAELRRYVELNLFLLFADGVTVLRNMDHRTADADPSGKMWGWGMGAMTGPDLLWLRTQTRRGTLWSPRMWTPGQWAPPQYVTTPETLHHHDSTRTWSAPRLDSVTAYVAAYKAAGYDFLKLHDEPPIMADSVYAAARRVGIHVEGHAAGQGLNGAFEQALAGGQWVTDHFTGWPRPPAKLDSVGRAAYQRQLAAEAGTRRRVGMWQCIGSEAPEAGSQEWLMLRAAVDSGAGVLIGNDGWAGNHGLPRLVEDGLTPYQVLVLGTKNFGRYLQTLDPVHGGETGTIAIGQRADLVLLPGNPMADMHNIPDYFTTELTADSVTSPTPRPTVVMVGGRWLARAELDRRLAVLREYWRLVKTTETLDRARQSKALAENSGQRSVPPPLTGLDSVHAEQQFAFLQRFVLAPETPAGAVDSLRGPQLLVALLARQLGEVRAALPAGDTAARTRFDTQARMWLAARAKAGFAATIPGVRP